MRKQKNLKKRSLFQSVSKRMVYAGAALTMFAAIALPVFVPGRGQALLLQSRSLKLSSSATGDISVDSNGTDVCDGTDNGGCGAEAKHTASFTMASSGATIGGILIMYCTSPIFQDTCTTPEGMTVDPLTSISVEIDGSDAGFTLDEVTTNATLNAKASINPYGNCNGAGTTRDNCVIANRTAAGVTGTPTVEAVFGGGDGSNYVRNPIPTTFGNENYSFFARILVFSDNTYDTVVDYGGVAASTAQQIDITAIVRETLRFSVGTTPTDKVSDAACTPFNDTGALILGDSDGVLDPALAYDAYSYFRVNTNTVGGTVIAYSGNTLISGANNVDAINANSGTAVASDTGTEQFGLALDTNHDPDPSDPAPKPPGLAGSGDAHSFTNLAPTAEYDSGDGTIVDAGSALFAFNTASMTAPINIATSTGGIVCDTGAVRYIANISTSTPAGIYRTTITFIATGTY